MGIQQQRLIINRERLNIMSVKVAIRVRPFNQRQQFLGCICCVDMKQNTTILYENKQKNKKQHYFTFDYSLWSHDEFTVLQNGYMMPTSPKYVDQQKIYNIIGRDILENAWQGYNCCLFAYGQTGAGKSYSMIGYGANRGIIPMVCQQIFKKIKKYEKKGEKQYQITLSMLEIYNQKVQDLFTPTSKRTQNGLKVRQNKTLGVYVEGLTKHEVFSYTDIERRMDEGSKNRSLASTLMNEYSSRAHTIIMIEFVQKEWVNKLKMNKKSSFINLVDLAGSERVSKTGISNNKDRLKEASNINKSLHTLGRVIETLAEQAAGKGKTVQVPYRDSSLTRILQTALGGNSKTIMICALSPANDNYQETLSTLRYADQTKKIKNKPIINESAVDKIIRELRQQNERLKMMLETTEETSLANSRGLATENEKKQIRSNLRASMRQVQKEIRKNLKSFAINTEQAEEYEEESLMMTEFVDLEEPSQFFSELSFDLGNKAQVYITNLNEDEMLNYKVRYSCERDILITNKNNKKSLKPDMDECAKVVLCGLGVQQNHAKITRQGDRYFITALSETSAEYTLRNGKPVYEKQQLVHNDRIILGINSVFIFKNNQKKTSQKQTSIDYQFAINERQQQMENISLISPTSLNLFLPNNFIKGNLSRQIYATPPLQSLNKTKKLMQPQNDTEIFDKLTEIQKQFSKMVKENQEKMREKQQFYKGKLTELKQQKEKQKQQKSTLQQKLMIKSIESESLKTKNVQLQKLKEKLSKYNNEKTKRLKARESMLLETDRSSVIEEDIIGEFVQVEDPNINKKKPSVQFAVSTLQNSKNKNQIGVGDADALARTKQFLAKSQKNYKKNGYNYEDVIVEQFDESILLPNQGIHQQNNAVNDSMLLVTEQFSEESTKQYFKKQKKKQQINSNQPSQIKAQIEKRKKSQYWQFRRIFNIKILCQMETVFTCSNCNKSLENSINETNPADQSFISKYLPVTSFEDASLEEFHYKNSQKRKIISREQLNLLQQQILELQNQLLAKQAAEEKSYDDDLLLNYSMDRQFQNARQSMGNRSSFRLRKQSDSYDKELQLNLTMEQQNFKIKQQLKHVVTDFIQILEDLPELAIHRALSQTIIFKSQIKSQLAKQDYLNFQYRPKERSLAMNYPDQMELLVWQKQIHSNFHQNQNGVLQFARSIQQKYNQEIGINTELYEQQSINEKGKITSFTAFLNQQFQQSNQNQTQASNPAEDHQINLKQYVQISINTDETWLVINDQIIGQRQQRQKHILVEQEMVTDINMETYSQSNNELIAESQLKENNNNLQKEDTFKNNHQSDSFLLDQQQVNNSNKLNQKKQEQLLQQYLLNQQHSKSEKKTEKQQNSEAELEQYLQQKKEFADTHMNTSIIKIIEKNDNCTNTNKTILKDASINALQISIKIQTTDCAVNTEENYSNLSADQQQIEQYLERQQNKKQEEELQRPQQEERQQILDIQKQILIKKQQQAQIKAISQKMVEQKIKSLALISQQVCIRFNQFAAAQLSSGNETPIKQISPPRQIELDEHSKLEIIPITIGQNSNQKIQSFQQTSPLKKESNQESPFKNQPLVVERDRPEMVDEQVQINSSDFKEEDQLSQQQNQGENSNQIAIKISKPNQKEQFENKMSGSFVKEFNLDFSDIQKQELSFQEMSAMGFDGLLKQDQLNSKIKLLEEKIRELELQSQQKNDKEAAISSKANQEPQQPIEQLADIHPQDKQQAMQEKLNNSKYVPIKKKKKKKKAAMTEEQKKQHEIQKQIQAKIIQCNNQNLINERNLQIHKRKRQAEQLRKILFKKQKIELQKQLLFLIPMIRRFNLIAKEMKRLIQAKISIQYRNFSHYQMIEVLKNYSTNRKNSNCNIQIKIIVFNCEEGRMYSWASEVFKNRYEIAEQTFQKYLENEEDPEIGRKRGYQDRNQKTKDPFWDPVDYIPQGVSYLSMEVLLYNLTYEGYISIVYRSIIIAKVYVTISPVKVKKYNEEDSIDESNDKSQMDHIQIYNQRNLLEKDIYFTISIESIVFMKKDQRQKLDESQNSVNLTSLNSNILKYTISYQLLEDDYKMNTYVTPEIDFVEHKQFKRIDYLRRHCFKNISEATLAYISDCPIKFTLNVMKDYNEECLNASFNNEEELESEHEPSEMDTSVHLGSQYDKDLNSKKNSIASLNNLAPPKDNNKVPKSDFSKKASVIYENAEVMSKLEEDLKKEQQKKAQKKKLEDSRTKSGKGDKSDKDKDKDKDCVIY